MHAAREGYIRFSDDDAAPLGKDYAALEQFFVECNELFPALILIHFGLTL
ncbi:hypothetical protein BH10PSE16_BH10PSE16_42920 [soil metagenome]